MVLYVSVVHFGRRANFPSHFLDADKVKTKTLRQESRLISDLLSVKFWGTMAQVGIWANLGVLVPYIPEYCAHSCTTALCYVWRTRYKKKRVDQKIIKYIVIMFAPITIPDIFPCPHAAEEVQDMPAEAESDWDMDLDSQAYEDMDDNVDDVEDPLE